MRWFEGKIPDAIHIAKQKGSLFIVYVHGKDELSEQMNATWESETVSKCIEETGAVAVKIENTSDECKFFSQIYPVVVVPSMFCIGEGGVPLEVIGGHVEPDKFVDKLKVVEQMHAAQKESNKSATVNPVQPTPAEPSTQGQVTPASTGASTSQASAVGDQTSSVTLEEKVERAKDLLDKKRGEKAQQEFEKGREEEIKRRKLGQGLQKLKHNQQDTQMSDLKTQMKKDKEDEKMAREKIRKQIAQDREERQVKFEKEKQDRDNAMEEKKREKLVQQQQLAAAEEARRSETARIQVRLPDGSSVTHSFASTDVLQSLHTIITEKVGKNVTLSTTFPKRRFTEEDMTRTFADLELAPTSVLIALPVRTGGGTPRQASSSSALTSGGIFSLLFSPFILVWNFFFSLFGGGGSASRQRQSSQSSSSPQAYTGIDRPNTATQRRGGDSTRRDGGNMRRMTDMRDDDDDMTTYNGNSTQQL